MAVDPAPIQEKTTNDLGFFPNVWVRWFSNLIREITDIDGGTP